MTTKRRKIKRLALKTKSSKIYHKMLFSKKIQVSHVMLASILEKVYVSKTDKEKIKSLLEEHNKSKNWYKVTVQHCNQDI